MSAGPTPKVEYLRVAEVVEFTDADTGEPFELTTWTQEMRPGEVSVKRINIKNIHGIYPIRLINLRPSGLAITRYPNDPDDEGDIIRMGETRTMELQIDVPRGSISPPITTLDYDIGVIAVG